MALDYRKCAEEIFSHLGGKDNIASAAHCATRLRLAIVDNNKVDTKALEETEGVKGVFSSNGQLQLIIGTGTVNKVYDEFLAVTGLTAASKEDVKAAAAAQMPLWKRLIKSLGDVFVPILPAIVASGLMMGVVEALGKAIPTFGGSDWFSYLDMVANAAFVFLPAIVAASAARVFGGNIFLGAVIGMLMIHPALLNAWTVGGMESIPTWKLLFFNVPQVGYQGHVIPVVISVWFMSTLEKWLHKHVPEMIDLFVTPLTTVFVTAFLTFTIIGPIFSTAESYVLKFAQWLITVGYGVGSMAMGAVYPWTVVMGLHHMYNVIEAGLLSSDAFGNLNIWMPIASAANFAQFGACLAVGLKTKNNKTKAVAIPSSLSAALGITEPAIFGVNLRLMKPFIFGMIGGAVGAMFGSWMGIGATAYGVTGIPGYLIVNKPLAYTILLAISGGIAFALTFLFWKEDAPVKKEVKVFTAPEAVVMTTEAGEIVSPINGKVIPAAEIPDPMFAQETMGPSVGVEPEEGVVYAPFDGSVMMLFPTKHAIGLVSEGGMEVLVHVGVDTVQMNGDGFEALVEQGAAIKKGDKLLTFDIDKIREAGHPATVIVALTNGFDYKDIKKAA
ncbi:MAG: PTS glucose transporter subunit IIA [Erysipelotrichaceae bacterium]|nr:PTS glucose transporter subunit IIA [Erysipelotrichaceae bacterium]